MPDDTTEAREVRGDVGARPDGPGSRASTEPASGLVPSGFDPSRVPMPPGRPLHVIAIQMSKSSPGMTTTSMVLSYRAGCGREEALGSAMLAAEREKPGFAAASWLLYTFEEPSDSDGSPKGGDGEAGSVHDSAGRNGIAPASSASPPAFMQERGDRRP